MKRTRTRIGRGNCLYKFSDLVKELHDKKGYPMKEARMIAMDVLSLIGNRLVQGDDIIFNGKFSALLRTKKCSFMDKKLYRSNAPGGPDDPLADKVIVGRKPYYQLFIPRSKRRQMMQNAFKARVSFDKMMIDEE